MIELAIAIGAASLIFSFVHYKIKNDKESNNSKNKTSFPNPQNNYKFHPN
jgi:hypothetical protein